MFLVNTDHVPGKTLEMLGFVSGSRFVVTIIDNRAIERAIQNMVENAEKLGADAIVNIRYTSATNHAFVSGTAAKFV